MITFYRNSAKAVLDIQQCAIFYCVAPICKLVFS